jgi:3-hydroxybutyryl-CoA dehydrogenase
MEKLTVIGSGTMGHSITLSAAWAGINVNMYGLTETNSAAGINAIRKKLEGLVVHDLIHFNEVKGFLKTSGSPIP